jgi:hypothetical protein
VPFLEPMPLTAKKNDQYQDFLGFPMHDPSVCLTPLTSPLACGSIYFRNTTQAGYDAGWPETPGPGTGQTGPQEPFDFLLQLHPTIRITIICKRSSCIRTFGTAVSTSIRFYF